MLHMHALATPLYVFKPVRMRGVVIGLASECSDLSTKTSLADFTALQAEAS